MTKYLFKNITRNGEEFTLIYKSYRGDDNYAQFGRDYFDKLIKKHQPNTENVIIVTRRNPDDKGFYMYNEEIEILDRFDNENYVIGSLDAVNGWRESTIE